MEESSSSSSTPPSESSLVDTPTTTGNNDNNSNSNWTDDEFEVYLHQELQQRNPNLYKQYPKVFALAPKCILKWRQRYQGNPSLWKRIFQKDRVIKEFIEAVPIIDAVQTIVNHYHSHHEQEKLTILDLACGRGYLSMFLSEMLPPSRVEKFVLVDKQWPLHGATPKPHHISWTHIYGSLTTSMSSQDDIPSKTYYETWPIPLNTSKQDLKCGRQLRQIEALYLSDSAKPVIIVAVHLCGTLSLKAIELFNRNPDTARFLCLKPCCLPGMIHAKRMEIFQFSGSEHSFDSRLVCMAGKWNKNVWNGPPRHQLQSYFQRWANNLFWGIDATTTKKIRCQILVQSKGGYQNEFLFAERKPETKALWEQLLRQHEKEQEKVEQKGQKNN
eukprot:scaffold624_cov150-Cylindrotheca_fusiformis.AAC.13